MGTHGAFPVQGNHGKLGNPLFTGLSDSCSWVPAKKLLERDIVHCDETPVQVLKEDGKKPQTKSYMWLYRTGDDGKPPVILYDYQPSRNGDHAVVFLKDFNGFVHSDGYSGYNKLTGITRCGCWAHLRRRFIEAIPKKTAPDAPPTNAEIGRDYCNQLFEIERDLKHLSPEKRKSKRLELEKPILEAFWCWLENLNVLNGSALGKAVTYAKNQKKYMENYLLDGRCSISNNAAENAIRPFTVGRKNWLFADTPKGASASAAVYSIIETAKANGLNVYTYLEYLLLYMPDTDWKNHPEELEDLMPWSAAVYSIIETAKANGLNVYTYLEYLLLYMPDTDWKNHPEELEDLMPWSAVVQAECK